MNVEAVIIDYLKTALNSDHVYAEVPERNKPDEYIVIDKTGSSTNDWLCTSTIAIQSYAKSKLRAAEINEDLKEAMEEIESIEEIAGCHLNSDYNFSNISKKQHRYQAVFEITHY